MNTQVEKKEGLDALLREEGFKYEFFHPDNISHPVFLIKDYALTSEKPMASFAFPLMSYYDNGTIEDRKCWMSCEKVKLNQGVAPKLHLDYGQFQHENITYFPFSVDISAYNYSDINSIKCLCRNLYEHLDFGAE